MAALMPGFAAATHPIQQFDYQFIASDSHLDLTVGFTGLNETYSITGSFSLQLDPFPHPPDSVQARFANVDATLNGPPTLDGANLDDLLNLSGLEGVIDGPALIHFDGTEGQGQPIHVDTMHLNIGLKLDGSNLPHACGDFFEYGLDAIAIQVFGQPDLADFDFDLDVDHHDRAIWENGFGTTSGATLANGDADEDGDVDGRDLLHWQAQFGAVLNSSGSSVPEPTSGIMLMLGMAAMLTGYNRS